MPEISDGEARDVPYQIGYWKRGRRAQRNCTGRKRKGGNCAPSVYSNPSARTKKVDIKSGKGAISLQKE